jgi:hypothetical protein
LSEDFSYQPLSAIPSNSISQFFRRDNPEASFSRRRGGPLSPLSNQHRQEPAFRPLAGVEHPLEFPTTPDPAALVEPSRRRVRGSSHDVCGMPWDRLTRGNREALSALGPAPLEHLPPLFGAHAHEKSVSARTAMTVWLKGTFHGVFWSLQRPKLAEEI